MSNNLEKFYEKKELFEIFDGDIHDHFLDIRASASEVTIGIEYRISQKLAEGQNIIITGKIKESVTRIQKEMEKEIKGFLLANMQLAQRKVKDDLGIKEVK